MSRNYTLALRDNGLPPVYIGEKLYRIEVPHAADGWTFIKEKCPVCDGKGVILYRGFEVKCSYCAETSRSSATSLTIRNFVLQEYIVHGLEFEGPTRKNAYGGQASLEERNLPACKSVRLFTNFSRTNSTQKTESIWTMTQSTDPEKETVARILANYPEDISNYYFSSKAYASEVRERAIEGQKEKLRKFNQDHGTNHPWPWKEE